MTSSQGQLPRLLPGELHQFGKTPSPMYIVDRETLRCLAVNDAALRLYGYASEEFLGLTLSETRHPDDDPVNPAGGGALVRHCGLRRHVKRSGEVFLADVVVQDVLFEERHASLVLLLDTSERTRAHSQRLLRDPPFGVSVDHSPDAIARDITDRKRAELAPRASEPKRRQMQDEFEALADALPQSITCYDRQLRHTYANAAMERATGRTRAELIGRTATDLGLSPEQAEAWTRSLRRVLESGEVSTFEFDVPGAAGSRRYETQHIPLVQNGGIEGVIGVAYDITDRTRAEADRLSQMSTQRDELIGEVHHRVKNSLQGAVGLLRQLASVHVDVAPILDKAVSQLHAMEIVHGLQGREGRDGVLLEGLVTEIAKSVENTSGMQVSCVLDNSGKAHAYVREQDAVAVALVLRELMVNACKHGSSGTRRPLVKVRVAIEADRMRVAVTNPGSLPEDFDFSRDRELGAGLELVKSLLPPEGAQLAYSVDPWSVTAVLNLEPPVLSRGAQAGKALQNERDSRQRSSADH